MKERVEWIDIARGMGIILVILGHTLTTVIRRDSVPAKDLYQAIYHFHMPFMFLLSGVAFNISAERYKSSNALNYLSKKCKKLLVPYFSYSILIYLCFFTANSFSTLNGVLDRAGYGKIALLEWFIGLALGENKYCVHVWYIYSLFFLSLLAFVLLKILDNKYKYVLLAIGVIVWFTLYSSAYPGVIQMTAGESIWFAAGTFVSTKCNFTVKQKIGIFLIYPVVQIVRIQFLKYNLPYKVERIIYILDVVALLLVLLAVAQLIEKRGDRYFTFLGRNSFPIYLFHQPFFGSGLGVILYGMLHLNIVLCIVISFISCIVFPLLFDKILKQERLKILRLLLLG